MGERLAPLGETSIRHKNRLEFSKLESIVRAIPGSSSAGKPLPSPTALGEPERGFPEGRRIISARPAIFFKILVDRSEGARLYSDHSLRRDCRGRPVLSIRLAFQAGVCRRVDASAGTWLKRFFDKWELKEKRGRRGSAVALSDHEIPAASRLRAHMDSESCSDVRSVNA